MERKSKGKEKQKSSHKGIDVGGFVITREEGKPFDRIKIEAKSGFWSIKFRQDNPMFELVRVMANDKEMREYLETWIHMIYLISSTTPDLDFMKEFYDSFGSFSKRREKEPVSDEEDNKILDEMRILNEEITNKED